MTHIFRAPVDPGSGLVGNEEKIAAVRPVAPVGRVVATAVGLWEKLRLLDGTDEKGDGDHEVDDSEKHA